MRRGFGAVVLVWLAATATGKAQQAFPNPVPPVPPVPQPFQPGAGVPAPVGEVPFLTEEERKVLAPYLTDDGRLTSPIQVSDEQGGRFGTFAGVVWRIEPDGAYSVTQIFRRQPVPVGQGRLSREQLKDLAQVLAANQVLTLTNYGPPLVNPHIVRVTFGGTSAAMTFGVDQRLAPVDPTQGGGNLPGRFAAVTGAVRSLTEANGGAGAPLQPLPPPAILNPRLALPR